MEIAYGPPGATGVKQLAYVGDDADYTSTGLYGVARPASFVAAGVWVFAALTGAKTLKKQALAVSVAAFVVSVVTKPR